MEKRARTVVPSDGERYRRFVTEDFTGVLVMRTDGQIVTCNPAVVSIFGFDSAEEAQAANFFSFLRSRQDGIDLLETVRQQGMVDRHELDLTSVQSRHKGRWAAAGGSLPARDWTLRTRDPAKGR